MALFDLESYTGTFTRDLFATEETTYFDDVEQFHHLQHEAVENLSHDLQLEGYDPVTIYKDYYFSKWDYRDAEESETGGAVIHLHPSGEVETHINIIHRDLDKKATEPLEKKPRATYSKPLCEYIAMYKTLAVQSGLLNHPRIAKELAIVQMVSGHNGISLKLHKALSYFAENEDSLPPALLALKTAIEPLCELTNKTETEITHCFQLCTTQVESTYVYDRLKDLSDDALDQLHLLLSTLCFGQLFCDRLDTDENSLFNRVANDLNIDMREYWIADEAYLSKRSLPQIREILLESGLRAMIGNGDGIKKSKLVEALCVQFKRIADTDNPTKDEQTVQRWLPAVFQFPAIDPDVVIAPESQAIDDTEEALAEVA